MRIGYAPSSSFFKHEAIFIHPNISWSPAGRFPPFRPRRFKRRTLGSEGGDVSLPQSDHCSKTVCSKSPKPYSECFYKEQCAKQLGGTTEVTLPDGTRCDILTDTHAIEVDFADKWAEAIGQSLNYAIQANAERPNLSLS